MEITTSLPMKDMDYLTTKSSFDNQIAKNITITSKEFTFSKITLVTESSSMTNKEEIYEFEDSTPISFQSSSPANIASVINT